MNINIYMHLNQNSFKLFKQTHRNHILIIHNPDNSSLILYLISGYTENK